MPIFYATAGGVVFDSTAAQEVETFNRVHDSKDARDRLSDKLAELKLAEQEHSNSDINSNNNNNTTDALSEERVVDAKELAVLRTEDRLQMDLKAMEALRNQQEDNKLLARIQASSKGKSKAIASQFVHKQDAADNAEKRAIVHHTGSHYHMAGSRQFQRGVRVKGVVSRHSKQGAKLQSARVAKNNGFAAREDARGERAQGAGKSHGKSAKKNKSKKGAAEK
jgi:hypothetical protein